MSLRITGGAARGRSLPIPVRDGVRPTSGRVREAWFSVVGQQLAGLRFLDAFAGSGLMAAEAWSRGAEVVAVERDRSALREIRARMEAIGATVEVRAGDVTRLASELGPFDLIYADPPYAMEPEPILVALADCTRGTLTLEADARASVPAEAGSLRRSRVLTYGGTALHLFEPRA